MSSVERIREDLEKLDNIKDLMEEYNLFKYLDSEKSEILEGILDNMQKEIKMWLEIEEKELEKGE